MSTPIFLLKTKSSPNDGYEEYFLQDVPLHGNKWDPVFVPVLEHKFHEQNLNGLEEMIGSRQFHPSKSEGNQTSYGGLIFTSQRAVEAFSKVIDRVRNTNPTLLSQSDQLLVYVVGPATARSLRALNLGWQILGEECGNGDALADFILEHYNGVYPSPEGRPPVIFFVGEQHRDIIPTKLRAGIPFMGSAARDDTRVEVHETTTYASVMMNSFTEQFSGLVKPRIEEKKDFWVVVFSPTGSQAMLEILGLLNPDTSKARPSLTTKRTSRIATIGPTTRDYLVRSFGFHPDVVAHRPSPSGLGAAIDEFEKRMSGLE